MNGAFGLLVPVLLVPQAMHPKMRVSIESKRARLFATKLLCSLQIRLRNAFVSIKWLVEAASKHDFPEQIVRAAIAYYRKPRKMNNKVAVAEKRDKAEQKQ